MLFLFIGYALADFVSLAYIAASLDLSSRDALAGFELYFIGLSLVEGVAYLIAYAIGRRYSRQQARPWWAFLLLGAGVVLLERFIFWPQVDSIWFAAFHALSPYLLFFAIAWLPVGRLEEKSARGEYQCPHCNNRLSERELKETRFGRSTGRCSYCNNRVKRGFSGISILIWLLPAGIMLFCITVALPEALASYLTPASFIGLTIGISIVLSRQLEPVDQPETIEER
jgi:hypothetical protein